MSGIKTPAKPRAVAHAGTMLGLLAIAAFCVGLLLFILDLRQVATHADDSNRALRATIMARCEARVAYDERAVESAQGDAEFYAELLRIAGDMQLPESYTANQREAFEDQKAAIELARDRKLAIVREGLVPGNCKELYAPLP